jgi:hypothetical protein
VHIRCGVDIFAELLLNNDRLFWLHYSGFQALRGQHGDLISFLLLFMESKLETYLWFTSSVSHEADFREVLYVSSHIYPANHILRDFITKKKLKRREEYETEWKEMIVGH